MAIRSMVKKAVMDCIAKGCMTKEEIVSDVLTRCWNASRKTVEVYISSSKSMKKINNGLQMLVVEDSGVLKFAPEFNESVMLGGPNWK